MRSLECLAEIYMWNQEPLVAVDAAKEITSVDAFRGTVYQILMRAYAQAGNRAEALRAYGRFRKLLSEELGVDPSPQTKEVYLKVLRSSGRR